MKISSLANCRVLLAVSVLFAAVAVARADEIADANLLFKQGHDAQALTKVDAYLAAHPGAAKARFLKGLILTDQGKTAEAIKVFSAMTEDYPDLPEPYNNLAVLYAGMGQYDKARQLLEQAISTHPSYATAHENLGDIYAKMASQAYDRALQLDNKNTATQTKLAMIQNLFAANPMTTAPPATTAAPEKVEPVASSATAANQENTPAQPVFAVPVTVVTASAVPAATVAAPAAEPAKPNVQKDRSAVVTDTVTAWAAAWSAQDVGKYLSYYADDFKVPGGATRAAWEAVRRERVSAPKFIAVDVRISTVQFTDANHAVVKFRQAYRSNSLNINSNKTLSMEKSGDRWLIQEERSH